jgi:hypothetical protein
MGNVIELIEKLIGGVNNGQGMMVGPTRCLKRIVGRSQSLFASTQCSVIDSHIQTSTVFGTYLIETILTAKIGSNQTAGRSLDRKEIESVVMICLRGHWPMRCERRWQTVNAPQVLYATENAGATANRLCSTEKTE